MKLRKALAFVLALVMLSTLFAGTAAAAPVAADYTFTGGEVTVNGTADVTVEVPFTSVNGGSYYAFQADWAKKETGDTAYLTLSALTPGGTASPMENDPNTGKTYWTEGTFSAPVVVTEGQPVWKATYTVDKNTPTGEYAVSVDVKAIIDTSYDGAALGTYTATIKVTNNSGEEPPTPEVPEGYSVSAVGDASINVGEDAAVSLNVTHKDGSAYNAYYFEVTYDSTVLTYKGVSEGAEVDSSTDGELKIAGYGAEKESGTAAAVLTFTGKAAGTGTVTITKANVDAKENANVQDAPAANIAAAAAAITVDGYGVTLPDGFTGASGAAHGADYTFTGGEDSACYDVTATMGGASAEVTRGDNGTYTISNVTGEIVVKATPKSYNVTVTGSGAGDVSGAAETATYKTDYTFRLAMEKVYTYTVTVTVNGTAVTPSATADGVYTIPGAAIKGDVTVNVEKKVIPGTTTTITITGNTEDVDGALNRTAKNGDDFTFRINKKDGYNYTVKAGDTTLEVDADGTVTIPGELLTGAPLTVTVTKTARNPYGVEVYEYVKLGNAQSVWLVVAKSNGTLVYGADVMYNSEKYGGYCWLVISGSDAETVKAEAVAAIKTGEGTPAAVAYTGDVNGTGNIDVNDAQLVYNIYNAVYGDFTATSMAKFLAADVNGDKTVNVNDAAAVVSKVLGR